METQLKIPDLLLPFPESPVDPWPYILGFLLLVVLFWLFKPRKKTTDDLTPLQRIRADLERLRHNPQMDYAGLTRMIKSYLLTRFSINLLKKTTEEAAPLLREAHREALMKIFQLCDVGKFSPKPKELETYEEAIGLALGFVDTQGEDQDDPV